MAGYSSITYSPWLTKLLRVTALVIGVGLLIMLPSAINKDVSFLSNSAVYTGTVAAERMLEGHRGIGSLVISRREIDVQFVGEDGSPVLTKIRPNWRFNDGPPIGDPVSIRWSHVPPFDASLAVWYEYFFNTTLMLLLILIVFCLSRNFKGYKEAAGK